MAYRNPDYPDLVYEAGVWSYSPIKPLFVRILGFPKSFFDFLVELYSY